MKALLLALASLLFLDAAHDFNGSVGHQNTEKILFVGNSLTFFHSLPNTVAAFTHAQVRDVVAPGYSLQQHWNDKVAAQEMSAGDWDVIVLQGKSTEFNAPEEFLDYGHRFGDLISRSNSRARVLLYETFANDGKPDDQPKIHDVYSRLASEMNAQMVPVGDAFYFAHGEDPSLQLWINDRLHPTTEGTYFAACVFYEYLTKRSPVGLPWEIPSNGEGEFADVQTKYSLPPNVAKHLQELAWKFYSRS